MTVSLGTMRQVSVGCHPCASPCLHLRRAAVQVPVALCHQPEAWRGTPPPPPRGLGSSGLLLPGLGHAHTGPPGRR